MKEEQDDSARSDTPPLPGFGTNPFDGAQARTSEPSPDNTPDKSPEKPLPHETSFIDSDHHDDEAYEEPDRDTDYTTGFREISIDEDEAFEELLPEELEEEDSLYEEQSDFLRSAGAGEEGETPAFQGAGGLTDADQATGGEPDSGEWDEPVAARSWREPELGALADEDAFADEEEDVVEADGAWLDTEQFEEEEVPREWVDEAAFPEEEAAEGDGWPIGLIAVGVLALLLVIAGGYGVMQQRSATQEQIRELQAALATAASPEDLSASRTALQDMKAENAELSAALASLRLENQRLADTVAGLEAQVEAQASEEAAAALKAKAQAEQAAAEAAARAQQAAAAPAATGDTGWFVNFSSYGQRDVAQGWAEKLQVPEGEVIVAPGTREGRTFYRVRVVGLRDKAAAETTARRLEAEYGMSKLWVGRQ